MESCFFNFMYCLLEEGYCLNRLNIWLQILIQIAISDCFLKAGALSVNKEKPVSLSNKDTQISALMIYMAIIFK